MAEKETKEKTAKQPSSSQDPAERFFEWIQAKKRPLTLGAGAVALIGGSAWFVQAAQARREAFAGNALQQARVAVQAGNLQLAASDLGRVVTDYGTTHAGADATILLARVHLQQGDAATAVRELRASLNAGPDRDFRSPASALLGTALEELTQFGEASLAFESAANASEYPHLRDQLLLDAARTARLAGDDRRALGLYERILEGDPQSPAFSEAELRKGEIEAR